MATLKENYEVTWDLGGTVHRVTQAITNTVTEVYHQIVAVPTSEVTLFSVGGAAAGATFLDFDYLFLQNLDAANYVEIGIKTTGASEAVFFRLQAGESFFLRFSSFKAYTAGGAAASSTPINVVTAKANTASVSMRVIAAN